MKRLLLLTILGMLLGGAAGATSASAGRYAWNSRFHPSETRGGLPSRAW